MSQSQGSGISSHGTIVEGQFVTASVGITPGVFYEVPEIGDITMPGLMRNEFDITSHNRDIDTYALGVLRRQDVKIPMFFNANIDEHVAVRNAILNNDICGWRITAPAPDGTILIFSGGVKGGTQTNPVDGVQKYEVSIRPTGAFILDGVTYGT